MQRRHYKRKKRRYRLKPLPITILCVVLAAVIGFSSYGIYKVINADKPVTNPNVGSSSDTNNGDKDSSKGGSSETVKPPSKVRIISTGDNLIHDTVYRQARERAGGNGYDFKYAYENLEEIFSLADIKTINQETVLSGLHDPSGYPMFNTPQAMGDYLVKLGFDVVNHATNHVLDKGVTGVNSTLDFWKNYGQVQITGVFQNQEEAQKVKTITKNDITFSFVGMTESLNGLNLPANSEIVINRTKDVDKMCELVKDAKAKSDVTVVNVHWGSEYTHKNSAQQSELAKKLVNAGADVIIGHHPHVIQPVEYITADDGRKAVVVYSLGNLVSSQDIGAAMIGGLLDYEFTKNHQTNKTELTNVRLIPIVNHYERNRKNVRVYPFDKYPTELGDTHGIKYPLAGYGQYAAFSNSYVDSTVKTVIDKQFLTPYK